MTFKDGPYIQVACFCDTALEAKDGTLSIIRIIDLVNHRAEGKMPPDEMPPFKYRLKLVLMIKSGNARGRHEIRLIPEMPSGIKENNPRISIPVHFEGEERGQNFILDIDYEFTQEGVYWFHVYLDDEHFTAIPFRIKYLPVLNSS